MADSAAGALFEYQQESSLLPPATIAAYVVSSERVVDFTQGYDPKHWSEIWAEAQCNWKQLAYLENIEPPSWIIGDLVRAASAAGMLYHSVRNPNTVCLVLYPEQRAHFSAPVHDPEGKLPLSADSWRSSEP